MVIRYAEQRDDRMWESSELCVQMINSQHNAAEQRALHVSNQIADSEAKSTDCTGALWDFSR